MTMNNVDIVKFDTCTLHIYKNSKSATILCQHASQKDFKAAFKYASESEEIDVFQWNEGDITYQKPKRLRDRLLIKCVHTNAMHSSRYRSTLH